jgi:endonuclease YncB( thermonuclease family)
MNLLLWCLTATLSAQSVMRVIDGDTFALYHVGVPAEERVRVLDVDTPERNEAGFMEARLFTQGWLMEGPFTLTTCKRDSFGRLLGQVTRGDTDLTTDLKAAGWSR